MQIALFQLPQLIWGSVDFYQIIPNLQFWVMQTPFLREKSTIGWEAADICEDLPGLHQAFAHFCRSCRISLSCDRKKSISELRVWRFATALQRFFPSVHRIRIPCLAKSATMAGASWTSKNTMLVCAGSTSNPRDFRPVANLAAFSWSSLWVQIHTSKHQNTFIKSSTIRKDYTDYTKKGTSSLSWSRSMWWSKAYSPAAASTPTWRKPPPTAFRKRLALKMKSFDPGHRELIMKALS